ncbi:MAG: SusC/RagA family TonB-linked outer membrane protein [Bacteroidia bacterium]|nr:SusC/RagA family TonB-linked outer membrane protein [Bacteroidia bacterium]
MFIHKSLARQVRFAVAMLMALALSVGAYAQDISVSGKVTDKSGEPVIGAYILVKGTTNGTTADLDGNYTISVPGNGTLEFSMMGMKTLSIAVNNKSVVNAVMEEDGILLEEAVIVAEFGMKRTARSVGSAVQNVKAQDIAESGRESFVSALQGRVAGMTVTSTGGAPGASTSVVLRSITSISGNNQPLYVIDGVPMNNSTFDPSQGFAVDDAVGTANQDFSSRGNDINPEDIESMTVLKGAAAAALYGSDASNGAIVITTKKGSKGRGKVSYSNSFRWDKAYGYPEIQNKYGNGAYGTTNYYYTSRFGAEYIPGTKLYDNIAATLQTGFAQTHNISVEGGTEKVTVRGSASYLNQQGVVKTTDFERLNITLAGRAEITKWLNFDANMSYVKSSNRKSTKGSGGPLYRAVRWPMTDNMLEYMDPDGVKMKLPANYTDYDLYNPLYALYKNVNYDENDRFMVNVSLNATPTKNTFLRVTMGWDTGIGNYQYHTHPYFGNREGSSYGEGSFNLSRNTFLDKTINALAGYNNEWGKFTFAAQVGYHQQENGTDNLSTYASDFSVKDFYSLSNCDPATIVTRTRTKMRRIQAISAQAEFGFNQMAFITLRARNDWSSTLPINNRSYFYPAIEGSFVATELPFLKGKTAVSYLKIRGAVAQVGKDATPLSIYPALEATEQYGGGFRYGYSGPNEALKPEMTTSYEIGAEARFLNDRINADFTYYWTNCEDQYVTGFRLSYATGFVLNNMNVGTFETQGWDLHIDGDIIRAASGFRWNLGVNLSHASSLVTELPESVSEYYNAYTWLSGNLRNGIMVGHPVTTMTGKAYQRNDNGDILINPSTGLPLIDADWSVLGDRQPKLEFGITTNLSYKGFRLSALATGRFGATVVNATKRDMMSTGSSWESVTLRESAPVVFKGVLKNGLENSANPTVNNIAVTYANYGSSIYTGGDEDWLEKDVNYLRLAEVRLSYNVPSQWLKKVTKGFVSSANVWVKGTDLVTFTNYSGIDPVGNSNSAALGGSGGIGIDYWGVPNPRGYAFGVSLTF